MTSPSHEPYCLCLSGTDATLKVSLGTFITEMNSLVIDRHRMNKRLVSTESAPRYGELRMIRWFISVVLHNRHRG